MPYFRVVFDLEGAAEHTGDILIACLSEIGFDSFEELEHGIAGWILDTKYSETLIEMNLQKLSPDLKIPEYSVETVCEQNWNKLWEESFNPVTIGDECCILAPFHTIEKRFRYRIVMEPRMSFGTGHHETTRMMIRRMLDEEMTGKKVLDMGSGTGILSILASMMGAQQVIAVDCDAWASDNIRENLTRNSIGNVLALKQDHPPGDRGFFDLILANINRNILLDQMPAYAALMADQALLLISGFLQEDIAPLKNRAARLGVAFIEEYREGSWIMAVLKKRIES